MKPVASTFGAAVLVVATSWATAHADPGETREQLHAEFIAAQQVGDVYVGESGITEREMYPWLYPSKGASGGAKTRAHVRAELVAAQQACDFPENETGWTTPDLFRWLYGADLATAHGKTREQVRAELAAAQRAGDVHIGLGFAPRELYPDNYRQDAQTKAPGRTVAREPGRPSNH